MARQAVDEAISKSFTLKDFHRQLSEMGYRINFDPNRKYWTIIGKGWQRPKRLYKLGDDYTNEQDNGTHKGKFLCGEVLPICRADKTVRFIK